MQGNFSHRSYAEKKDVNRYAGVFAGVDGSIGYIMPVEEAVARLLNDVTKLMSQHKAVNTLGLNARVSGAPRICHLMVLVVCVVAC